MRTGNPQPVGSNPIGLNVSDFKDPSERQIPIGIYRLAHRLRIRKQLLNAP